jgi:PIN domain nuclease of toxin-antitoxin system
VRVVADSHALIWYLIDDPRQRLSEAAIEALDRADATDGIAMSVATMIDLWYVVHTRRTLQPADLAALRDLAADPDTNLQAVPIDMDIAAAFARIPLEPLRDPYDRLILATAMALAVPLVTRDNKIRQSGLVTTIW